MADSSFRTLYATYPDAPTAKAALEVLLEARLIACGNIIAGVESLYRWEGHIQHSAEVVLMAKTSAERAPQAMEWLQKHHPYALPAIACWPIETTEAFGRWVAEETQSTA